MKIFENDSIYNIILEKDCDAPLFFLTEEIIEQKLNLNFSKKLFDFDCWYYDFYYRKTAFTLHYHQMIRDVTLFTNKRSLNKTLLLELGNLIRLENIKIIIGSYFKNHCTTSFKFHSFEHTKIVAEHCKKASKKMDFSNDDSEILQTAAWFHDLGYLFSLENHEDKSIELVKKYLNQHNYASEFIKGVSSCIEATKSTKTPKNDLAATLKDIDISYALITNFKDKGDLLRREYLLLKNQEYTDEQWNRIEINFLNEIKYFSEYGKTYLTSILEEVKYDFNLV